MRPGIVQPAASDTRPLLSAEVPYFRVPRDDWELMLARMRQLGANTIATSVPWVWHEPQPGALDLAGTSHPQRDLAGFVQLCGQLGFRVLLKPGPYLADGLLGGGVPPWLLRAYPEIQALRTDGQPWRQAGSGAPHASALHPAYLAAAQDWIAAFSAVTRALQYPAGPVVAIQIGGPIADSSGLDPHFRLDYNPHVVKTLWPRWLRERHGAQAESKLIDRGWLADTSILDPPSAIFHPLEPEALRRSIDLDAFTDWCYSMAVATTAGWLRKEGWTIPLLYDLPYEACHLDSALAASHGLTRIAGWPGQVSPMRLLAFEDYVQYAFWYTRLARQPNSGFSAFAPQLSAAQDFTFAAPFLGGLQGANIAMALQTQPDSPSVGGFAGWAMEAPVRGDGSIRPRLWNAKAPFTLLGAGGADFAAALAPADLALGYSHVPERMWRWAKESESPGLEHIMAGGNYTLCSQALAQRLVRASVAFAVLDLDTATDVELARYALIVAPAAAVMAQATQARLARCHNLILIGDTRVRYDENLEACDILEHQESENKAQRTKNKKPRTKNRETRIEDGNPSPIDPRSAILDPRFAGPPAHLPEDVSGEQLGELIEERGGSARYAWADAEDVDVSVYYGAEHTYLFVANRRPAFYSGALTYRAPDGSLQHLHFGIGGQRVGMMILKDSEVLGAAVGGDGSEGGWLARGMHTSMVFNNGAGLIAPCGASLLLSAPQSGRFQIRRPAGWDGMAAYRLLLSGALLPAAFQIEAAHLALPYVAEDHYGQTDLYFLLPEVTPLPDMLHGYTATLLRARAAALHRAADLADAAAHAEAAGALDALVLAANGFSQAASDLEQLAARAYTPDEYGAAWQATSQTCQPVVATLTQALAQLRGDYLAGILDDALYRPLEERIARILGVVTRGSLTHDRE